MNLQDSFFFVSKLDLSQIDRLTRVALNQTLCEFERGADWQMAAVLSAGAYRLAVELQDRRGQTVCKFLNAVARRKTRDAIPAWLTFRHLPDASDRMNQAVAAAWLGRYKNAMDALDTAMRYYAAQGDNERWEDTKELRAWCEDQIIGTIPILYVGQPKSYKGGNYGMV